MTRTVATGRTTATGRGTAGIRTTATGRLGSYWVDPLSSVTWNQAYWASDPLYQHPADGAAASTARNGAPNWNQDTFLGDQGLIQPGVGKQGAFIPDSAATSIAGDITIASLVYLSKWPPGVTSVLAGKRESSVLDNAWTTFLDTSGNMFLSLSTTGTSQTQVSRATGISGQGLTQWVKAEWRQSDGRVQMFKAAGDGTTTLPGSWTQFGADATIGIASIFNSSAATRFGIADMNGTAFTGVLRRSVIWSGLQSGGSATIQADVTFPAHTNALTFTEASANAATVTVHGRRTLVPGDGGSVPTWVVAAASLTNRSAWAFNGSTQSLKTIDLPTVAQRFSTVTVASFSDITGDRYLSGIGSSTSNGVGISGGVWRLNCGTALDAAVGPTVNTPYLVRTDCNGASSKLYVNETLVASGNSGAGNMGRVGFGSGCTGTTGVGSAANFLAGNIGFMGVYSGDVSTDPQWSNFVAWARGYYQTG